MKLYFTLLLSSILSSHNALSQNPDKFLGHWTLDIGRGAVGWLQVTQEQGYLDAELLWRSGSVTPVAHVYLQDENTLVVTRTQSLERTSGRSHHVTTVYMCKIEGKYLVGVCTEINQDGIGVKETTFRGTKLPPVGNAPDLKSLEYGNPIILFNGKDLSGWEPMNKNRVNGFIVKDGVLVNNAIQPENGERIRYGNLRTVEEYEDFNLTLELNIPPHSNSGVYLRGIYEIQVMDSYGRETDSHNLGALYSRITPTESAEKPAGAWQTLDITLCERHITVILNGITIINNQPAYGPTGGAISSDVFAPGPIYLQGDHGEILYRNIVLKPVLK